jgi:hypothetical protein
VDNKDSLLSGLVASLVKHLNPTGQKTKKKKKKRVKKERKKEKRRKEKCVSADEREH